jgi:hypothetical protein
VDENVRSTFLGEEAVTLAAIKPLNRADDTLRHFYCLLTAKKKDIQVPYVSIGVAKQKPAQGVCPEPSFFASNENLLASY